MEDLITAYTKLSESVFRANPAAFMTSLNCSGNIADECANGVLFALRAKAKLAEIMPLINDGLTNIAANQSPN